MTVSIIAAMSRNRVIGDGPKIPWKVKGEQKLFREITMGGTLVMGRKTFDTIGKALPGRKTIIVTRQKDFSAAECMAVNSIEDALAQADRIGRDVFVIGGGEIYSQTINRVDDVHLSVIDTDVEGDVKFPSFSEADFEVIEERYFESNINYTYRHYQRR